MPGSLNSGASTPDSEGKKATVEASVYIPLANGKRDRESESPDNSDPPAGEMDPCLPPNNKLGQQTHDEIDQAPLKKSKHYSSNNSLTKKRKAKAAENAARNGNYVERLEDTLKEKTGLSRIGLIIAGVVLLLLFVFLIVIIVLGATWPQTPHSHLFPVCTRAACLQASAQMLPKMNTSGSPCDDFWNYACGRWLKDHPLPLATRSKWSQEEEMVFKSHEAICSLVTTLPHPTKDTSIEWKVKRLYESCMALDTIESDRYAPLRKIIHQLGGWHVLREFSILSWDYRHVLQLLHASYGVSPFFKVSVVPDPREPKHSMIKVSPAGLGLPGRSYYYRPSSSPFAGSRKALAPSQRVCLDLSNVSSIQALFRMIAERNAATAYKRLLRDAVQLLGATSLAAEQFSNEIFHFEKRIAEITPDLMELKNPLDFTITTVDRLKLKAPSIPLLEILLAMFPRANIGGSTEVLLPSETYLNNVSVLLSTTDRQALNNYMMWVLASDYLPYMSEEIRATVNYYRKEMTGASEPLQRWEMCVGTLQRFMGFAVATMQQQAMKETERLAASNVVNEMFSLTRDSVRRRVEEANWLPSELKSHELDKIDGLDLQVGFTQPLMAKEFLERYYSKLLVQKNDFFQNILYGVEFLRELQQERLTSSEEEYRWIDAMSNSRGPVYVTSANKVVVPLHFLVPPIFHPQYPISVLYGGLGVQLASAIVSSVLPLNIYYGADGKLLLLENAAVNQSLLAYQKSIEFLTKDLIHSASVTELVANRTVLSTLNQISAIRQAYFAMQDALSQLPHTHQPAMETFESDAIFFITHAQTLCSVSTLQQDDTDETISFQLKGSKLLKTSLKQVKSFTDAFSCSSHSSYYVSNVCKQML